VYFVYRCPYYDKSGVGGDVGEGGRVDGLVEGCDDHVEGSIASSQSTLLSTAPPPCSISNSNCSLVSSDPPFDKYIFPYRLGDSVTLWTDRKLTCGMKYNVTTFDFHVEGGGRAELRARILEQAEEGGGGGWGGGRGGWGGFFIGGVGGFKGRCILKKGKTGGGKGRGGGGREGGGGVMDRVRRVREDFISAGFRGFKMDVN